MKGLTLTQLKKRPLKEPTNLLCEWKSDEEAVVLEVTEPGTRRLKDAPISMMRQLLLEMEQNGVVDLTVNSHHMERAGAEVDRFTISPDPEQIPLVFKYLKKTQSEQFKFTTGASYFTNKELTSSEALRLVWREISPKKPLYFLKRTTSLVKQQVMRLI
ncbi:unnamed protein product [Symbiodinium sp. CCMP2592]|nr:unnamed protein product [Symbiodinium sp. CCMP2592]CAE7803546.1 unnamed protein product [Symbiodinium sp. CCMP2592]